MVTPQPKALTKVPLEENSSIRLLAESATQMSALESIATAAGPLTWPEPDPAVPKELVNLGTIRVVNVRSEPLLVPRALVAEILKW